MDMVLLFGPDIKAGGKIKVGHPAIMIGSEGKGWTYYSFHADDNWTTNDNLLIKKYDSLADAKSDKKETGNYKKYLYFATTEAQDNAGLARIKEWQKAGPPTFIGKVLQQVFGAQYKPIFGEVKKYKLSSQNCATFATDITQHILGSNAGFPSYAGITDPANWKPLNWWPNQVLPWARVRGYQEYSWQDANNPKIPADVTIRSQVNVKIWINGKAADQDYATLGIAGFQTNPLELGKTYPFTAKVQFPNGTVVERTQTRPPVSITPSLFDCPPWRHAVL